MASYYSIKQKLFRFLLKYKIIKKGHLNPIIIVAFIVLTPLFFMVKAHLWPEKYYDISDDEIATLLMEEYSSDTTWTGEKFSDEEDKKTEGNVVKAYISESKTSENNLTSLLRKAKNDSKNLSHWDLFRLKVYQCAGNLKETYPNINATQKQLYDWSMKTFYQESKFKKDAANPHSSARGIFQAMANVRKQIKMPVGLPMIQQVDFYEKYIKLQIDSQRLKVENIGSSLDWYLIVFYPALADDSDSVVFAKCNKGKKHYRWKSCCYHANALYDLNNDGIIYKKEIGNHLMCKY